MRRLVFALLAVVAVVAAPAQGASTPKPQLTDATGDSVGGVGAVDLVSALYRVDRGSLVVTLTLATAPPGHGLSNYELTAQTERCGALTISWTPGSTLTGFVDDDTYVVAQRCVMRAETGVKGDYITAAWTGATATFDIKLRTLPPQLGLGTVLRDFRGFANGADPATGVLGTQYVQDGMLDAATSSTSWRIG